MSVIDQWDLSRPQLVQEARRIVGPIEAEDVAQEALLRAWRNRASCSSPDTPLPWLRQIARREALRSLSRSASRDVPTEAGDIETLAGAGMLAALGDRPEHLANALDSLSVADRHLLALRFAADLKHEEIAHTLGVSPAAIRVRLHRMLHRLRAHMEEEADATDSASH